MHLGIDFGTCWSSVAVCANGEARALKEPHRQNYTVPSSAFCQPGGRTILIGEAAEHARRSNPTRYLREFKRDIGKPHIYRLGDQDFSVQQIVDEVLRQITAEACRQLPKRNPPVNLAIAVPARYENDRRDCISNAVRSAGFEPLLVSEPLAAALYYEKHGGSAVADGEAVLIYDFGGGTFDAALLSKHDDTFQEMVPADGRDDIGGSDFDWQIFNDLKLKCPPELAELLRQETDGALRLRQNILQECRSLKHQLSLVSIASIWIEACEPPIEYSLSANLFESMIRPHVEATIAVCRRMVAEAGLPADRPPRVVMVGGSTRIPLVARMLKDAFGIEPQTVPDPELGVCLGAALFAASSANPRPKGAPPMTDEVKAALLSLQKKYDAAVKRRFVFLLAGRAGVGKSSTINSLFGRKVADINHYLRQTMEVTKYDIEIDHIPFSLVDTPGLFDGTARKDNYRAYMQKMAEAAPHVDLLWFLTPLTDARVREDEVNAVKLISDAFGGGIWKHAIIVFTFANGVLPKERYPEAVKVRGELLREEIARHAGKEVADQVPAVPVENEHQYTLDKKDWRGVLYTQSFLKVSADGLLTWDIATNTKGWVDRTTVPARKRRSRLNETDSSIEDDESDILELGDRRELTEDQRHAITARRIEVAPEVAIITRYKEAGGNIGEELGRLFGETAASVGRSVGEAVGSVVGWVTSWFR